MKKVSLFLIFSLLITVLFGCNPQADYPQVVATTLPVYEFTALLCDGTDIQVGRLITENVSCLHDYSLQVSQMQMLESADIVILSGAGLESFMGSILSDIPTVDASANVHLHSIGGHNHNEHHHSDHIHDTDPHIWLSPKNAAVMAENICNGLSLQYPADSAIFQKNLQSVKKDLADLQLYGEETLNVLSCRKLITFHDGFGYFAESFRLDILESVEEESGSEASAKEIIYLANLVTEHHLPSVFIERSGSDACAKILAAETGAKIYTLDMAMAGDSYFDAMYHNIDTLKEALK